MTKEEEFIESLKALMIRYEVKLESCSDTSGTDYYFISKENKIDIYIGDLE